ncbi:MlaD family protein [Haloechinothrix salitolerans]|uniref:MlaD family protein n=1 Tax=Haloechinothrix salitolerans TaxID=926830 RepID=A0ABW2BV14_9PSEU
MVRTTVVFAFLAATAGVVLYLLSGTSWRVPLLDEPRGYEVVAKLDDADNMVPGSQIRTAGVQIGDVQSIEQRGDHVRVVLSIYSEHAPWHEGVSLRVGARSLVEETYLDVRDGTGEKLQSGSVLPADAIEHSTQLRDVIASLDDKTRKRLKGLLRSAGAGTKGTSDQFADVLVGLGDLGREGHTALDAIEAQSGDLRKLVGHTRTLLDALDTGEGQLATMVENAQRVTSATSGQHQALAESMRLLPGVVNTAGEASDSLTDLSGSLAPVAGNLNQAAPHLSAALRELPATSADLRGMLPALSGVLDSAPATLDRVPRLSGDMAGLTPAAITMLRDVNPMLAYLRPYGPEVAAWFANFNAISRYTTESGVHYFRLMPYLSDMSVVSPLDTPSVVSYKNPMPKPGAGANPGPFDRDYHRVERAPDPRGKHEPK